MPKPPTPEKCCEKCQGSIVTQFQEGVPTLNRYCQKDDCPCHTKREEGCYVGDILADFESDHDEVKAVKALMKEIEAAYERGKNDIEAINESMLNAARTHRDKELLEVINPTEIAERIVIEYANISGRESEYRAYVRQAALTVLDAIKKAITERGSKK